MSIFYHIGRYFILLFKVFSRPEKGKIYVRQIFREVDALGLNSLGIVVIISLFMGAVITLQTAFNIESPFVPRYLIGLTARDSMLLEFSSTIVGLILAGKVGSNVSSEIGTMRVTEQIDALEIMGINSASYLILPKIIGMLLFTPVLFIISNFVGIAGGWVAGVATGAVSSYDYLYGLNYAFIPYYISYAFVKSLVFSFIIISVSSYHGYHTSGGALEVGRSSTKAVVYSSILVLTFNLIITQLMLT
ncbi:MAG: ABC transporter permease [Bacteroidota bacterium]